MRNAFSKGMLTVAAVTGILSVPGAYAVADADANAVAEDSPGIASGNNVSVPVHIPLNVCGTSINVLSALNAADGNTCVNGEHHKAPRPHAPKQTPKQTPPPAPAPQAPEPAVHAMPNPAPQLAHTGGSPATVAAGGLGAVLLAGGTVLYRRGRAARR